MVWFLAPTVTLCEQQYEVFKSHLPGYGIQLLSGRDGVDHWSTQGIWDAVLQNIRIVLSTHQVLLDALTHAFVKISNISLLIFDEGVCVACLNGTKTHPLSSSLYSQAPCAPNYVILLQALCRCHNSHWVKSKNSWLKCKPGHESRSFYESLGVRASSQFLQCG